MLHKLVNAHVSSSHSDDQLAVDDLRIDLPGSKHVVAVSQSSDLDRTPMQVEPLAQHLVNHIPLGCLILDASLLGALELLSDLIHSLLEGGQFGDQVLDLELDVDVVPENGVGLVKAGRRVLFDGVLGAIYVLLDLGRGVSKVVTEPSALFAGVLARVHLGEHLPVVLLVLFHGHQVYVDLLHQLVDCCFYLANVSNNFV